MEIIINGDQATEVAENTVLSDLFTRLGIELNTPGIAIAVNARVISKSRWQVYVLKEGDKVEVVRAFQGG